MSAVMLSLVTAFSTVASPLPCGGEPPADVRVTVVVILASTTGNAIDPKLTDLAREVRKRNANLTSFALVATHAKSIPVGGSTEFKLVDKATLTVKAERPRDADGRISLTIHPPELGEITYACACGKFFPVVTPYKTAKGDHLIVAVMAKPCMGAVKKD